MLIQKGGMRVYRFSSYLLYNAVKVRFEVIDIFLIQFYERARIVVRLEGKSVRDREKARRTTRSEDLERKISSNY